MTPSTQSVARTDPGLASELRISVMRLGRRLRNERQPENPLSLSSLSALGVLHRHGEMSIGQLAGHEGVQPPSMTRTINYLLEEGYVGRRADENDRRLVLIDVTDKGRDTLAADRLRRDAWMAKRLRELSPAERELLREAAPILERLASA